MSIGENVTPVYVAQRGMVMHDEYFTLPLVPSHLGRGEN